MADKGPGTAGRSSTKRLARAKLKPSDNGIKSSRGRSAAATEALEAEEKRARRQKVGAIAIGAFAIIMALSMTLPSLAYIFGDPNAAQVQEQEQQTAPEADDGAPEDGAGDQGQQPSGMEAVDANYHAVIDPLEEKLKDNDQDLATLLSLGNNYMSWASEASYAATTDDDFLHVRGLYEQAIGHFDSYLALNDSAVVKSSRAMCLFSLGNTDEALAALEAITTETPDFGPAWANIGLIKEITGDMDAAEQAFQQAIKADPDDEYGSKSYAESHLAALAASKGAAANADADAEGSAGAAASDDAAGNN